MPTPPTPEPQTSATPEPEPNPTAVTGGPGISTPTTAAPDLRTVKIGGRDFQLPPDAAEAMSQREREYEQGFAKQGEELGRLRQQARDWESERERVRHAVNGAPATPQEPDYNTLMFTDPSAALQRFKQELQREIRGEREQQALREQFWTDFYGSNPDISRDEHWLVEATLMRHFRELGTLGGPEGQKKLGDYTRQAMLGIIQKRAPSSTGTPRTVVEGASGARPERGASPKEATEPTTLSEVIAARRRARRQPVKAAAS